MDLTGWLEYYVGGLTTQLTEVRHRGEQAIQRDSLVRRHNLDPRQAAALDYIIEHGSLTIQDYEALFPDVTRRTLQRDLRDLVDKRIVSEKASSVTDPARRYSISNNIQEGIFLQAVHSSISKTPQGKLPDHLPSRHQDGRTSIFHSEFQSPPRWNTWYATASLRLQTDLISGRIYLVFCWVRFYIGSYTEKLGVV